MKVANVGQQRAEKIDTTRSRKNDAKTKSRKADEWTMIHVQKPPAHTESEDKWTHTNTKMEYEENEHIMF